MKIPRSKPFSHIGLFLLIIGVLSCLFLTHRGGEQIIEYLDIVTVYLLILESDPPSVTVEVMGEVGACTEHHQTSQTREGNTITIQITTVTTIKEGMGCPGIALPYQETVTIGTLPRGDYQIIVNDVEQQLRL